MSINYKASNVWRNTTRGYLKVGNAWQRIDVLYVKQNGTWNVAAKRVPNVTGVDYNAAQATLTGLGFTVNKSNTNSTDTTYQSYPNGYVQSQVPGIDDIAHPGSSITLNTITYVATGPSFSPGFGPAFGPPPPVEPSFFAPPPIPFFGNVYFFINPPPPYVVPPPTYYVPPPYYGTPFGQAPSFFTFSEFSPYGCLLGSTGLAAPGQLILAQDIKVGDKILSLDIEELDLDEDKANIYYWLSGTFTVKGVVETTVTAVRAKTVQDLIRINNKYYSFTHLVLVERNSEYEFVQAQFVKDTDKVLALVKSENDAPSVPTFVPIEEMIRFHYKEGVLVYDISTEPYDVYFTENLLSHNK